MSGFRETFTRGEKDNILGYDDSASLYFAGCLLVCTLVPWSYFFLKRLGSSPVETPKHGCPCSLCATARSEKKTKSSSWSSRISFRFIIECVVLILLWVCCFKIATQLRQTVTIAAFDPYEILGVDSFASSKDIRRAYRTLSLKHHPDKNPNDPASSAQFILIAKAYQSLTDDVSDNSISETFLVGGESEL